jgi:hypothetical protein
MQSGRHPYHSRHRPELRMRLRPILAGTAKTTIGSGDESFGPAGFDAQCLAVLRGALRGVVISSAGVAVEYYAPWGITAALTGPSAVAMIETTTRHFADRSDFFEGAKIPILHVISSEGGHAL